MMKKAWKYMMIPMALTLLLSGCGHFTELVEHVASKQETTAEETQAILETTIPADQVVEPADPDAMRIELSRGAAALGFAHLMEESELGATQGEYHFELKDREAEVLSDFITGAADVAILSPESAARAYHDAKDGAVIVNINAGNELYCITGNTELKSFQGLKGKTVLSVGQGEQPEYVIRYLKSQYGTQFDVQYTSIEDITAQLSADPSKVAIVAEPDASSLLAGVPGTVRAFSLKDSWENVTATGSLISSVTLVHRDYYENKRSSVDNLLRETAMSIVKAERAANQTAKLAGKFGITQAAVVPLALPYANLKCITGDQMKSRLSAYLIAIAEVDSAAIGRSIPGEDFYYGYAVTKPEESSSVSRYDDTTSYGSDSEDEYEDEDEDENTESKKSEDAESDKNQKRDDDIKRENHTKRDEETREDGEKKKNDEQKEESEKKETEKSHESEKKTETSEKHVEIEEPQKPAETAASPAPQPQPAAPAGPDPSAAPAGPGSQGPSDDLLPGGPMG